MSRRRMMLRDHEIVTIPISDEAQRVFEEFVEEHLVDLVARFEPLALDPTEVQVPRLRQIVWDPAYVTCAACQRSAFP